MKRILTVILAILLCMSGGHLVHADGDALRVVGQDSMVENAFKSAFPDQAYLEIPNWDAKGRDISMEVLLRGDWDVAMVSSIQVQLSKLYEAGLLEDLSGIAGVQENFDKTYPAIQKAMQVEGGIVAIPTWIFACQPRSYFISNLLHYKSDDDIQSILDRLGLSDADVPKTFADLAALAERYMSLDAKTRQGTQFVELESKRPGDYFLDRLIEMYRYQNADANGKCDFDTALFREGLVQLDRIVKALNSDPKIRRLPNGGVYSVISDFSGDLLADHMESVPIIQLSENATSIPARATLLLINAKSPRKEIASKWLQLSTKTLQTSQFIPQFYTEVNYEALRIASYDEIIAVQNEQSVIDELIADRDSGKTGCCILPESIQDYAEQIAPKIVFPYCPGFLESASLVRDYGSGKLTHDALIQGLNALQE